MDLKLFGDFIREDAGGWKPGESGYKYRNRCADPEYGKMRTLLESWFKNYPKPDWERLGGLALSKAEENRYHLCTSFQAEDTQHEGAFFELYCHALLRSQGFTVDVQQMVDKSPIDFLVHSSEEPFYVEAIVASDPTEENEKRKTLEQLWHMLICELKSPNFHISFKVERWSVQTPPFKKMCHALERQLQSLDVENIRVRGRAAYPKLIWPKKDEGRGWKFVFHAIPKSLEEIGNLDETVFFDRDVKVWGYEEDSLLKALGAKAKKYKNLQHPYIIAANVVGMRSHASDSHTSEILLGQQICFADFKSGQSTWVHAPFVPDRLLEEKGLEVMGLWLSRSGPENRHVSAVLIVHLLSAGPDYIVRTPILWHNPWAKKRLNPDVWQGPQVIFNPNTLEREDRPGKEAKEILHLPPEWPLNLTLAC